MQLTPKHPQNNFPQILGPNRKNKNIDIQITNRISDGLLVFYELTIIWYTEKNITGNAEQRDANNF